MKPRQTQGLQIKAHIEMFTDDDVFIMKTLSCQSFFYRWLDRRSTLSVSVKVSWQPTLQKRLSQMHNTHKRLVWPQWDLLGGNVFRSTGPVSNPICVLHQDVHVPVFVQDVLFRLKEQTQLFCEGQLRSRLDRHFLRDCRQRLSSRLPWQQTDGRTQRRLTGSYLTVSPAGRVHVKHDLSPVLGGVGARGAACSKRTNQNMEISTRKK